VVPDASGEKAEVRFVLEGVGGREVDATGRTVVSYPTGSTDAMIIFSRRGGKWLVFSQQIDE
jgi:hypothetical protein